MTLTLEQKERVEREANAPREQRLRMTRLPVKYWNPENGPRFRPEESNAEMHAAVESWREEFWTTDGHGGRGLLLAGPPGVGKTMLCAQAGVTLSDDGAMVRFLPLAELISLQIRQFKLENLWSKHDDVDALREWRDTDLWIKDVLETAHLVILDDVGKEHRTESAWAEDSFDLFLRKRYSLGRPTIITTNIPLANWSGQYSKAMQSFVHEACEIVNVGRATDRRR